MILAKLYYIVTLNEHIKSWLFIFFVILTLILNGSRRYLPKQSFGLLRDISSLNLFNIYPLSSSKAFKLSDALWNFIFALNI